MPNRLLTVIALAVGILLALIMLYFLWPDKAPASSPPAAPVPIIDLTAAKAKAEQGDAKAEVQLAKALANGIGGKRDFKQAAQWYEKAAAQSNAEAQAGLGELYQAGQGVPRDLPRAVQLFKSAGDAGNVAAQYDLAYLYEQGQGVHHDEKEAAKWYRLASEGGDPTAQYDYGQRCVLGVGVSKDPVEGLKWLLIAAAKGQPDAATAAQKVEGDLSHAQVGEAKKAAAAFVPRKSSEETAPSSATPHN